MIDEEVVPYLKLSVALLSFICLAIFFYALSLWGSLLIPFIVAVFVYLLLQPFVMFLERVRVPRPLVTIAAMGLTVFILLGISQIAYQGVTVFTDGFPEYEDRFNEVWVKLGRLMGVPERSLARGWTLADDPRIAQFLGGTTISDFVKVMVASANTILSNLVLIFIFLLLLLFGRNLFTKKIKYAFSSSVSSRLADVTLRIRLKIQQYLLIKTVVSLMGALAVMLVTWLFGLDFMIIWGILTFFLNFIPHIGPIVAAGLPFLFGLVQFESPMTAVWMGASIIAVKFIIANVVEPKMMGKSINLSPLLIMVSLIFWGSVWGIVGMFLSVPLTAIVKIVFDHIMPLRPLGVLMGEDVRDEPAPASAGGEAAT